MSGRIGQATDFNGASSYYDAADQPQLDVALFTISAWVNPSVLRNNSRIAAKAHVADFSPYTMYGLIVNDQGQPQLEVSQDQLCTK